MFFRMVYKSGLDRSFFRFVTIHACDRQTDRQTDGQTDRRTDGRTEFSSLDRVCITCSAVKTEKKFCRRRILG